MINWHAVDKKNSTKNNIVFTKKLKSNMSLEVMPLINFIYFYHLDPLVVVLLLSQQLFMKFCYFEDLLNIPRVCRKGDDYYFT